MADVSSIKINGTTYSIKDPVARNAAGGPNVAAIKAAMTDKTKVYVYTGSETNMTSGNWYYWNGSAWASGGVYQSTGFTTDTTLTVSGMAADAKVTGDSLSDLNNRFNNPFSNVIADYAFTSGYYNASGTFVTNGTYRTTTVDISEDVVSISISGTVYIADVYRWNKGTSTFSRSLGVTNYEFEHQWYRYKVAIRKQDGTSMAGSDFTSDVKFNETVGIWSAISQADEANAHLFSIVNGQNGYDAEIDVHFTQGLRNANGNLIFSTKQIVTGFMKFSNGGTLKLSCSGSHGCYIMEYEKANNTYSRTRLVGGNTLTEILLDEVDASKYYVFTGYDDSGITPESSGLFVVRFIGKIERPLLSLENNEMIITGKRSRYTFKRVTDSSIRIDTWRLYKGEYYKGNNSFTAWENSDAEGAIKLVGEDDYLGGYHGDEIMENISCYLDGKSLNPSGSYNGRFDRLVVYVKSDIYHCNTSPLSDTIAFTRYKKLVFELDKVTISNCYIANSQLSIQQARIAMFQCVKASGSTPVFTNYSVNTNYKDYAVTDISTDRPRGSDLMTEAEIKTIYSDVVFKYIRGSDQHYLGMVTDMDTRIKFYFDTIAAETQIASGENITSEFSVLAK